MAAFVVTLAGLVLGVASPPVRVYTQGVTRHAVKSLPRTPYNQSPVPLVEVPASVGSLQGEDLVQSPSVFRGISPDGRLLKQPLPLGREEELEVRRRLATAPLLSAARAASSAPSLSLSPPLAC